jgi:uncharacterized protein YvpB
MIKKTLLVVIALILLVIFTLLFIKWNSKPDQIDSSVSLIPENSSGELSSAQGLEPEKSLPITSTPLPTRTAVGKSTPDQQALFTPTPIFVEEVTYCRDNLDLLRDLYPDFAVPNDVPCIAAPAPPNSKIVDVEYFNQYNFDNLNEDRKPCMPGLEVCKYTPQGTGCGPTAFYMALNHALQGNNLDYYDLWDRLLTSNSVSGTSYQNVNRVATELGVLGSTKFNMDWDEIQATLDRDSVVMLRIYRPGYETQDSEGNTVWEFTGNPIFPPYEFERYCGPDLCNPGGHWVLIVGYSLGADKNDPGDDLLIIHDPYTRRMGDTPTEDEAALDFGNNLVIKRVTLEDRIYSCASNWMAEIKTPDLQFIQTQVASSTLAQTPSYDATDNNDDNVEHVIDVPLHTQSHNLSCEASVCAMIASHYLPQSANSLVDWEEHFIDIIPPNCNPYEGFRGSIDGVMSTSCDVDYGYGVYAEPVAAALESSGIPASVAYQMSYADVVREIQNGHPVIVWVSTYDYQPVCEGSTCYIFGQHVWLVTGVKGSPGNYVFRINEPKSGEDFWVYTFPRWDDFTSAEGLPRMSVIIGKSE